MTLPTYNHSKSKPTAYWYLIYGKIVKKTRRLKYLVRPYKVQTSTTTAGK